MRDYITNKALVSLFQCFVLSCKVGRPCPEAPTQMLTKLTPGVHRYRLLRLGLPSSPSPEVGAELQSFVAQLRRGAERR